MNLPRDEKRAARSDRAARLHERRASMCPSCTNVRGEAFNISARNQQKTITYRCPSCLRTWEHTRPDVTV